MTSDGRPTYKEILDKHHKLLNLSKKFSDDFFKTWRMLLDSTNPDAKPSEKPTDSEILDAFQELGDLRVELTRAMVETLHESERALAVPVAIPLASNLQM